MKLQGHDKKHIRNTQKTYRNHWTMSEIVRKNKRHAVDGKKKCIPYILLLKGPVRGELVLLSTVSKKHIESKSEITLCQLCSCRPTNNNTSPQQKTNKRDNEYAVRGGNAISI